MPDRQSVERRLLWVLAAIAAVAVAGVMAIVPWRLYERDIRLAKQNAHRTANLLAMEISHALRHEEDVAELVRRFQDVTDVGVQLRRMETGELSPSADRARGTSTLDDTDLTFTAPIIDDGRGGQWIATMHFDLSPMKRDSVHLIIDLALAVVLGSFAFSCVVFWVVRSSLVRPLRDVTQRIERWAREGGEARLPEFESAEMSALARALERAAKPYGAG